MRFQPELRRFTDRKAPTAVARGPWPRIQSTLPKSPPRRGLYGARFHGIRRIHLSGTPLSYVRFRAIQPFAHLIVRQPQTVSLLSLFPVHPEPLPFEEASRRFTHLRRNPPGARFAGKPAQQMLIKSRRHTRTAATPDGRTARCVAAISSIEANPVISASGFSATKWCCRANNSSQCRGSSPHEASRQPPQPYNAVG